MRNVFVYGTLKKNCGNHALLERAEFIGEASADGFVMLDLGPFPACMQSDQGGTVYGEVYAVDDETFRRLDALEGYPDHYNRVETDVTLATTRKVKAWIYVYGNGRKITRTNLVESGIWRPRTSWRRNRWA